MNLIQLLEGKEESENLLLESGIKLPSGTKAVKMSIHADVDGFFSGLMAFQQLQKQGIDKDKIKINFIQYGDEESEMMKKVTTHNKQASVVLDFSALPRKNLYEEINRISGYKFKDYILQKKFLDFIKKALKGNKENKQGFFDFVRKTFELDENVDLEDYYTLFRQFKPKEVDFKDFNKKDFSVPLATPDFISDHHYNDKGQLVSGKGGKIGAKQKSDTEHIAVSFAPNIADYSTIKEISKMDSATFTRTEDNIDLPKNFKQQGRMERLAIIINTLLSEVIKKNPTLAKEILKASSPSLVSVYNNILKMNKYNNTQVEIFDELSKKEPDWNKVDSLRSTLPETMKKETTKEDLKGVKKFKTREEWKEFSEKNLEKSKTGYAKTKPKEEDENEYLDTRGKLDLALSDAERRLRINEMTIKTFLNRKEKFGEKNEVAIEKLKKDQKIIEKNIEKAKKNLEDYEKKREEKSKERQGQFLKLGNVMRQDVSSTKDMPSRYLGSLLVVNGERMPFTLRRFSGMIQVSLSPEASEQMKKEIDLAAMAKKVLSEVRAKHETFSNKWAFEKIEEGSGGHKGITTFSNLNMLGLLPKNQRERIKELEELAKRATKADSSLRKVGEKSGVKTTKWDELKELRERKQQAAEKRTEIMNDIEKGIYKYLWDNYKHFKITKPIKEPERYKMNN